MEAPSKAKGRVLQVSAAANAPAPDGRIDATGLFRRRVRPLRDPASDSALPRYDRGPVIPCCLDRLSQDDGVVGHAVDHPIHVPTRPMSKDAKRVQSEVANERPPDALRRRFQAWVEGGGIPHHRADDHKIGRRGVAKRCHVGNDVLVGADDLSHIKRAFDLNGYVGRYARWAVDADGTAE